MKPDKTRRRKLSSSLESRHVNFLVLLFFRGFQLVWTTLANDSGQMSLDKKWQSGSDLWVCTSQNGRKELKPPKHWEPLQTFLRFERCTQLERELHSNKAGHRNNHWHQSYWYYGLVCTDAIYAVWSCWSDPLQTLFIQTYVSRIGLSLSGREGKSDGKQSWRTREICGRQGGSDQLLTFARTL